MTNRPKAHYGDGTPKRPRGQPDHEANDCLAGVIPSKMCTCPIDWKARAARAEARVGELERDDLRAKLAEATALLLSGMPFSVNERDNDFYEYRLRVVEFLATTEPGEP